MPSGDNSTEPGPQTDTQSTSRTTGTGQQSSSRQPSPPATGDSTGTASLPGQTPGDTGNESSATGQGGIDDTAGGSRGEASVSGGEVAESTTGGSPGDSRASGPATSGERIGVLDEQLDESLAVFDGMILTERRAVQVSEDANIEDEPAGGSGDGADGPLFEEADLSEPGSGGQGPGGTGDRDGDSTVPPMPGGGEASGPAVASATSDGGVPPDLVDGSDDDIVARQIREAAMNEEDPELREKLWEEYRKYKNQQRGN